MTDRLPALYLGHGAPPLVDDALWTGQLARWAADLPRPTAILIVSAHWESAPLTVGATADAAPLVYDFGGFPARYYQARYPAPDLPVLQMSLPTLDPAKLLELGRRLRPLRDEGVLVIGSGFLTHGLPFLRDFRPDAPAPG